ncbi:hypothetical protein GeomeDRAFT_0344 [Geobacter metallireducens RCH3]|nr:geopeptide [Geobacter metallireducens]EHP88912.1 hypothetical protein GeomeDRAFT_0344 [Geobacter metallireducens RCH3]
MTEEREEVVVLDEGVEESADGPLACCTVSVAFFF